MLLSVSSLGSLLATSYFLRALVADFLPPWILVWIKEAMRAGFSWSWRMSIVIEEFDYHGYSDTFEGALRYLSYKFSSSAAVVRVSDSSAARGYSFNIDMNQTLHEEVNGRKVSWSFRVKDSTSVGHGGTGARVRYLELSFDRSINQWVREHYFPLVLEIAREEEVRQRTRKLYTNRSHGERGSLWSSVAFSHPSTFQSLAIHPELKASLIKDLNSFRAKKDYYKRVGRAWKRGYLLYGPPGTGKTSLIAAIANYLEFDVYDLELTAVASNSQLRKLLVETKRKSMIVIEDIDRTITVGDDQHIRKRNRVPESSIWEEDLEEDGCVTPNGGPSLSGILNFMDGLWSCCGEERIMVVTTNHKERLDPALLRPGRLDVHVNLSYCGVEALRELATNYLDGVNVGGNEKWGHVEKLLVNAKVTPATVAEVLMGCESAEVARVALARLLTG
ncbi:AAA-ATPase At3g50940-like [Typha angustifolia]|uniref:AAA-ATPase At3g50940-like n=1 Tax=Typha angustifolia TaxID=59011 RepID=UPI003C2C498E